MRYYKALAKTKRLKQVEHAHGELRRRIIRVVTQEHLLPGNTRYGITLYKANMDVECSECTRRIKQGESFSRGTLLRTYSGFPHDIVCLRCRPVARY